MSSQTMKQSLFMASVKRNLRNNLEGFLMQKKSFLKY